MEKYVVYYWGGIFFTEVENYDEIVPNFRKAHPNEEPLAIEPESCYKERCASAERRRNDRAANPYRHPFKKIKAIVASKRRRMKADRAKDRTSFGRVKEDFGGGVGE